MSPDARLLRALHREAAVPLGELAQAAGLEPGDVVNRLDGLRAAGYLIEPSPHLGYRLVAAPDRLISDDIVARLSLREDGGRRLGREIVVFEETASTNDVATHMARSGVAEGVAVFAERQTAGRGRLGRKWDSAAHQGLWFSIVLRPEGIGLPQHAWAQLTTWAAVGVARALEEHAPAVRAGIKWPNDIYLHGRKAVGILIEGGAGSYAVVGIGVNVNQTAFPEELQGKATSLRLARGGEEPPLDRMAVATSLLHHLDALYGRVAFTSILEEAARRSILLGEWIEVNTPGGCLHGMAEGLNADGTLRLRTGDGQVENLSGGEVSIARW